MKSYWSVNQSLVSAILCIIEHSHKTSNFEPPLIRQKLNPPGSRKTWPTADFYYFRRKAQFLDVWPIRNTGWVVFYIDIAKNPPRAGYVILLESFSHMSHRQEFSVFNNLLVGIIWSAFLNAIKTAWKTREIRGIWEDFKSLSEPAQP